MEKLFFLLLIVLAPARAGSSTEQGTFEVVANSGSRATAIRIFFSEPFKTMPKDACTATFTKPGIERPEHGTGNVQEYSLMWVQIISEVGERVHWTCIGAR